MSNFASKIAIFQAKMMKHESPSMSEITKPMDLKILHNVKNVK